MYSQKPATRSISQQSPPIIGSKSSRPGEAKVSINPSGSNPKGTSGGRPATRSPRYPSSSNGKRTPTTISRRATRSTSNTICTNCGRFDIAGMVSNGPILKAELKALRNPSRSCGEIANECAVVCITTRRSVEVEAKNSTRPTASSSHSPSTSPGQTRTPCAFSSTPSASAVSTPLIAVIGICSIAEPHWRKNPSRSR